MTTEERTLYERYKEDADKELENVYKVQRIFEDYFTPENVEVQIKYPDLNNLPENHLDKVFYIYALHNINCNIPVIIRFPHITVTNENGNSTELNNLFTKIFINIDGKFSATDSDLYMLKSQYKYCHIVNKYMHSHVPSVNFSNMAVFQRCCLGSGPINNTIRLLKESFLEEQWLQFCWDLDKYVRVESLLGIPYLKLLNAESEIGKCSKIPFYTDNPFINTPFCKDLIKYVLQNNIIKFTWHENQWVLGMSFKDYVLALTKACSQLCKEKLKKHQYPTDIKALFHNVYINITNERYVFEAIDNINGNEPIEDTINSLRGIPIIFFKNEQYNLIIDEPQNTNISYKILNCSICITILLTLLTKLNTLYEYN